MAAKINLRTGKIIGAEEGSFAWWHEKGHLEYDNSEKGITNGVNQNVALYCSLLFLVLDNFYSIFGILATISVFYLISLVIYEETWCNAYAREQMDKISEYAKAKEKENKRNE